MSGPLAVLGSISGSSSAENHIHWGSRKETKQEMQRWIKPVSIEIKYPLSMKSRMRIIWPCGFNKAFSLKFQEGYWVQLQTAEQGQRIQQPKCECINQDQHYGWNSIAL